MSEDKGAPSSNPLAKKGPHAKGCKMPEHLQKYSLSNMTKEQRDEMRRKANVARSRRVRNEKMLGTLLKHLLKSKPSKSAVASILKEYPELLDSHTSCARKDVHTAQPDNDTIKHDMA